MDRTQLPTDAVLAEVERLRRLTRLLDDAFRVPVIGVRVGMDSLVGLIPGIGDAATAIVSCWVVLRARQLGVRRRTVARMVGNVVIDLCGGTVPVLGDLFDVGWKSNTRNLSLLERELGIDAADPAA